MICPSALSAFVHMKMAGIESDENDIQYRLEGVSQ
jgi:hypothetical protein